MDDLLSGNGHRFGSDGQHEPEEEKNSETSEGNTESPEEKSYKADKHIQDLDPKYVPTGAELAEAAERFFHDIRGGMLAAHDDPQAIAGYLDRIIEYVRAASQIKGSHQADVIRMALSINRHYWVRYRDIEVWQDLLLALLSAARDIKDYELQCEIYRAWGLYQVVTRQRPRATQALKAAFELAVDTGRKDLQLVVQAERFNLKRADMSLEDIQVEANAILADVRPLNLAYVEGRIYLSLAFAYEHALMHDQVFMCAQQALAIFLSTGGVELAGEAASKMLGSLQVQADHSIAYQSILLTTLAKLAGRTANPWFEVPVYHHRATVFYQNAQYDQAREYILKAWIKARQIEFMDSRVSAQHMLGLIQSKRQRWAMARRHLKACYTKYKQEANDVQAVQVKHALAYTFFEQGDYAKCQSELEEALSEAQALPEDKARQYLIEIIEEDLADVTCRLE